MSSDGKLQPVNNNKISEKTNLLLAVVGLCAFLAAYFTGSSFPSPGLKTTSFLFLISTIVAAISFIHARLERNAYEEKKLAEENGDKNADLFGSSELSGESYHTFQQFEKIFSPAFNIILALAFVGIAYFQLNQLKIEVVSSLTSPKFSFGMLPAGAFLVFILFSLGKFAAGYAYKGNLRHLKASSGFHLLASFFLLIMIILMAISYGIVKSEGSQWRNPDYGVITTAAIIFFLLFIEAALSTVFSFYRKKRQNDAPVYNSKIASLLASPGGVWNTFSDIFEYQFGVTLTSQQLSSFIYKAVLPFIAFQLITLSLISCLFIVPANNRGFVERFGKPVKADLFTGLHFKLPYPIEKSYLNQADLVNEFIVGSYENAESDKMLWSQLPENAPLYLSSSTKSTETSTQATGYIPSVNLIAANLKVTYSVDKAAYYLYKHQAPLETLKKLARRELTSVLVSPAGKNILQSSPAVLNQTIKANLNKLSEDLQLGITIKDAALDHTQPAANTNLLASFRKTVIQQQNNEADIHNARKYHNQVIPKAKINSDTIITQAEQYRTERQLSTKAKADVFNGSYNLYKEYKGLYTTLSYLEKLTSALTNTKKIVVGTDVPKQIMTFDLKDEFNPDLLQTEIKEEDTK